MKNRGLLILFAVFIALAAIIFLSDRGTIGGGNQATVPTAVFLRVYPDMAVLDILAIQLEDPVTGQTFAVARAQDGQWEGVGFSDPLNQELTSTIAASVVLLPYTRTIDLPTDGNLSQYGLGARPQFLVSVITADRQQHIVAVGNPLQSGPEFYALVDDREQLYVIQRSPIDYLAGFLSEPPLEVEGASITP